MCLSKNAACKKCNPEMELVRLSVNVNQETAAAILGLMSRNDITATETLRRAIAITHYFDGQSAEGGKILTMDQDGTKVKEVVY
jgi:hypothetical protein